MTPPRKPLADTFSTGGQSLDDVLDLFEKAEAADDLLPLPAGTYRCRLTDGKIEAAKTGTVGYVMQFVVSDGEHAGRRLWHHLWLTDRAVSMAKRDLSRLGITTAAQMKEPLPAVFECDVRVALLTEDDGSQKNRVRDFAVVGIVSDPSADPAFS